MGIKEKVNDLKLRLKNDKRLTAAAGFLAVVVLIVIIMESGKPPAPTPPPRPLPGEPIALNTNAGPARNAFGANDQTYQDLLRALKGDVDYIKKSAKDNEALIERLKNEQQQDRDKFTGLVDTIVDTLDQMKINMDRIESAATSRPAPLQTAGGQPSTLPVEPATITTFGDDLAGPPTPPPAPPVPVKMTFISPGDAVDVKLLTGVNAPVDGTPYPVVLKLTGPITGPDGSTLEVGEARVIGAATGSETDERVHIRLTTLAMRHNDGRRSVVKVDGWIAGEDGMKGLKGKLVDKLVRLILATAGVSAVATMGERLDDKSDGIDIEDSSNVTIESDDLNVAGTSAFTDASRRLTEVLINRYEKMIPVVEVLSGRSAVAVFSAPVEINICEEDCGEDDIHYSSLD